MQKINVGKAGLALGVFGALIHVLWSALVYLGLAQFVLDFIFDIHMIMNPMIVLSFDIIKSLELIAIVFVVWYFIGYIIATLWNYINR